MTQQQDEPRSIGREELAKIVTLGRTSQLPHVAVVRFVQSDGSFFVLAGKASYDWVQNALRAGNARLRLGDYSYEVRASAEPDTQSVLSLFSKKYGRTVTEGWYSAAEACLRLTPSSPAVRRDAIKGERATTTDFSGWRAKNTDYYHGIARAFDSASEEYDFTIRNNFINRWIRDRSISVLLEYARPDDVLLEIGCGTGTEAIQIAKRVSGVVATDISPEMMSLLKRKVESRRLGRKISMMQVAASEIGRASANLPSGKTRVAYSFNGALNCEPAIAAFPGELAEVMDEGGFFVCSIRNTLCISEVLAHVAALQWNRLAPRKKQPVMVSVGGMDVPAYYYSPDRFASFFSSKFRLRRMLGLPAILPPAYLSDAYFRARSVLSMAERLEVAAAGSFPFNRFGDQTLFVFQKI